MDAPPPSDGYFNIRVGDLDVAKEEEVHLCVSLCVKEPVVLHGDYT